MNIIDHGFNKVEIYQIRDIANCDYAFRSYEEAEKTIWGYLGEMREENAIRGVQIMDYKKVYEYDEWVDLDEFFNNRISLLGNVYEKFNLDIPADFNGHSMSVSDLICVNEESWYYVDDIGFKYIGDFDYHFFKDEEFRVCSECGDVMIDGYVINDGDEYYCCDECLHKHYTEEEYLNLYYDGDFDGESTYYTQWF